MKTAIIVHGTCYENEYFSRDYPSPSNSHWLPWLQKELIIKGYAAHTPEIPASYKPNYSVWKTELERYKIDVETTLIGHSCGGGFLLRWLSENPISIDRLVLVAPWLDPIEKKTDDFFGFVIDPKITDRIPVHLLHSDNDEESIQISVGMIKKSLPDLQYHEFNNHGHFCQSDLGSEEFPALLNIILGSENI